MNIQISGLKSGLKNLFEKFIIVHYFQGAVPLARGSWSLNRRSAKVALSQPLGHQYSPLLLGRAVRLPSGRRTKKIRRRGAPGCVKRLRERLGAYACAAAAGGVAPAPEAQPMSPPAPARGNDGANAQAEASAAEPRPMRS